MPKPIEAAPAVVLSVPPALRESLSGSVVMLRTYDQFAQLFASARKSLKIAMPYVDPSFTALVALTQAPVQIITTAGEGRGHRASPVLERCAALRDVTPRYLAERQERTLLFQMHSKMIIADSARAYVGSAGLTDTAIHYNLELGLNITDPRTISQLDRLFDSLWSVAVPARSL